MLTKKIIPAVSIIIPMYNAEKYIGECLDSILAQTFTDYEVIIVDDCSTDNSCAVVESYAKKFQGKFQLVRLKVNSGNAGVPRNIGIQLAIGEYVFCVDSDDLVTATALEELYPIAKKFDADVVDCERYYSFESEEGLNAKVSILSFKVDDFVTKPTLISDNLFKRVDDLLARKFVWMLWTKLIRRKFIIENNLQMVSSAGQDMIFTCCLTCSALRYVRVPNIINFYRVHDDSVFHDGLNDGSKVAHKWLNSLARGFQYFDNFLDRQPFFMKNPEAKYQALEIMFQEFTIYFIRFYEKFPAYQVNYLICHELEHFEKNSALTAYLFSRMNILKLNLSQQNEQIQQLQDKLQQAANVLTKQQEIISNLQNELKQK